MQEYWKEIEGFGKLYSTSNFDRFLEILQKIILQ